MSIFARSPHIITIAETGQTGSKIELFLWNGTGSAPASPQYTLSKLIPATNNLKTEYNVSPYVREYIKWTVRQTPYNNFSASQTTQYVNVKIKRYKLASGTYTLLDTTDYKGYDGFGYYEEGFNPSLSYDILHDQGDFYYNKDLNPSVFADFRAGFIMVKTGSSYKAQYTNLVSGTTFTQTLTNNALIDVLRVYPSYYNSGNSLVILDGSDVGIWGAKFWPQNNCKYDAVLCDFVNKYGCWQRTWFYAASNNTLNVESQEYNLMQTATSGYNLIEGQRQVFNNNGKKSIKVNTDWVDESYNELLRQIMLSEKIIINNYPAKLNSKSTELFKSINTKMINYTLEFEFSFDVINSVV